MLLTKIGDSQKFNGEKAEAFSIVGAVFDERLSELSAAAETDTLLGNAYSENQKIPGWFDASKKSKKKIKDLCANLEVASRKLSESRRKQRRAPDADTLKPIFESLSKLNQEKGALVERMGSINASIESVKGETKEVKRSIEKIILANKKIEAGKRQLELADKAQKALDEYSERLIDKKINDLRKSIAQCFNHLIRKDSFVEDVVINPETFEVTLFDKNKIPIQKDELSSGEKQLFAISILWALAKSSGRELPVIIDTPLGRLDSEHRVNLVKHYFPNAAHQVIVLSTDTEVDKGLFNELKPCISHCYHLKYNKTETRTSPTEGYFWGKNGNG
jgi:DNA sulfur modification protein DndD